MNPSRSQPRALSPVLLVPPIPPAVVAPAATTVLVFEPGKGNQKRAEELVVALGYRAEVVTTVAEARRLIASATPPEVVLAGLPGGEAVMRAALQRSGERPSLLVALSGQTAEALERCEEVGADAFVLRPYKRDSMAVALRSAAAITADRRRVVRLEAELATERARLLRHGDADPSSGFPHFTFFKKMLEIELKRARRFGYSLAACLVAMDAERLDGVSPRVQRVLMGQVARRLRGAIRDIDLPVDYADGRFLVFLPYTDLAGAERVGRRLEASVRSDPAVPDGDRLAKASVSIGIAALRTGRQVSFAKLVRDASMALRAAQLKGGARVVVKR